MLAARRLTKLCVTTLAAAALAAPLAASAGGLKITVRLGNPEGAAGSISYRSKHLDYSRALVAVPSASAPRYAPPELRHHLGAQPEAARARVIASGAVALDDRTFVLEGVHYRIADAAPLALGTPESIAQRKRLQALLDEGGLTLQPRGVEPSSGIRRVTLHR